MAPPASPMGLSPFDGRRAVQRVQDALRSPVGLHSGLGLFVRTLAERFREADERLSKLDSEPRQSRPR